MTTMIFISVDSFRRTNTFSGKITATSVIGPCTPQIYRFLSLKKGISRVFYRVIGVHPTRTRYPTKIRSGVHPTPECLWPFLSRDLGAVVWPVFFFMKSRDIRKKDRLKRPPPDRHNLLIFYSVFRRFSAGRPPGQKANAHHPSPSQ
jgi:hypothetical protein